MGKRSKKELKPTDEMRSMWEFVFISQFLRVFQGKFGFVRFEPEDLENEFLEEESYPLFSIFASLMRILSRRRDIRMNTWQPALSEELGKRKLGWNPLADGAKYSTLSPENKVLLLKNLIDLVCEKEEDSDEAKFAERFLNADSEGKPPIIGQDAENNVYWYFADLRLYREKTPKKGAQKKSWETVCTSATEWDSFVRSIQKTSNSQEKKLHQYLQDELLPTVLPQLKDHEKEKELKIKKKRSKSTKQDKEDDRKEEERNALLEQEEQELERMKQVVEADQRKILQAGHRKKGRRRESEEQEDNDIDNHEHIKQFVQEEESMAEDVPMVSRAKRRCVIIREQTKNKKEWWEEEGIGSDNEEEEEYDSDGSDGPRRKKKSKIVRAPEIRGPPNRMYMFSTALANRAADAVSQGRVDNIISFHRAQQSISPYLRPERGSAKPTNKYEQQKAYFSQQYPMGTDPMMARGFGGLPGESGVGPGRPGFGGASAPWQQYQMQQQYLKEKGAPRQGATQVEDNIHQLLFGGNAMNGSAQSGANGMYPGSAGYSARMAGMQQASYGFPPQQQPGPTSYDQYRPPFPQGQYPGYGQQQQQAGQQQPQQFFTRPRQMTTTAHSPTAQSPSAESLSTNVRSPPPYPGSRPGDCRQTQQAMPHMGSSPAPLPSPSSAESPQTPLTPHTPRFPSAVPSPGEPTKPPFSPTNQQASFPSPAGFSSQKRVSVEASEADTQPQSGFIDLGSKSYQKPPVTQSQQAQNPYSSISSYNQSPGAPLENRTSSEEGSLHSPLDGSSRPYEAGGPPNKSPFLPSAGSPPGLNHNTFATSSAAAMSNKSFSVESLTAPSQPTAERGLPQMGAAAEPSMPPYGGLYYQSKYHPGMFGQARYQYPPAMQHAGPFYNSQLQPNVYYDTRGSLPVYPPGRDGGL